MTTTIDATETTLPELLENLQPGDTVVLTAGDAHTPIARVESLAGESGVELASFEPLDEEELRLWHESGPDDPLNWSEERIRAANAASDRSYSSAS
jgi:selenocysteine lyase/cysteine desulfurase